MSGYFYHGRHRKPTTTGRTVARAAMVSAAMAGPTVTAAPALADDGGTLDAIAKCESGGDPRAQNPHSTASGKYQMLDSTWRGLGGSGRAKDASEGAQDAMAAKLLARSGTAPWNPSRGCWGGKIGAKSTPKPASKPAHQARRTAPAPERAAKPPAARPPAPRKAPPPPTPHRHAQGVVRATNVVTVSAGDTLSAIAAAHHRSWRSVWEHNRDTIHDPDLIFPGERITVE
jgi:nucleoid-associated protein YgaU